MKKISVGVDFGGTNIKMGLVDGSGRMIDRSHLVTKSFARNKKKLINALVDSILDLLEQNHLNKKDVLGIGLGLPGLVDPVKGIVNFLPNVPGWHNVPLKNFIQKRTKILTFLDNDVNLITLGEWKYGAGKGYRNLVCMTLGTGIGGGLILNGALYRGEGFAAGEIGHMPINEKGPGCPCGGYGCFERYVGNQQLLDKGRKIFKNKNFQLEDIFDLANQGNVRAVQFWRETATHVGNGLIGIVNLLNPQLIIIGGGVSNNFKFLRKTITRIIDQRAMKVQAKIVKVVKSKLGDDAGILGGQVLVKDSTIGRKN